MEASIQLSDELASFIEGGVSIVASAVDAGKRPTLSRALGCRVSADRRRVTLYFSHPAAATLLRAVSATGTLAVVFSEPSTHRSVQVKGGAAEIAEVDAQERHEAVEFLSHHTELFGQDLIRTGFDAAFTRTLMRVDPGDLVTISFAPSSAFSQTPGPKAGSSMEP